MALYVQAALKNDRIEKRYVNDIYINCQSITQAIDKIFENDLCVCEML